MITPSQFITRLQLGNPATWKAAMALYRRATGNPPLRRMAKPFSAHYSTVATWLSGKAVPSGVYRRLAIVEVERIILPLLIQEQENEILKGVTREA